MFALHIHAHNKGISRNTKANAQHQKTGVRGPQ